MELSNKNKIKILEGALKVLGPEGERWMRGEYTDGHKYCLLGAIGQSALDVGLVEGEDGGEYYLFEEEAFFHTFGQIGDTFGRWTSISGLVESKGYANVPDFNDHVEDFQAVRELVEERIAQLLEKS